MFVRLIRRSFSSDALNYSCLKYSTKNKVALVQLHRPEALNALNRQLMDELKDALRQVDASPELKVAIITGNEKSFAAGADISEMAPKTFDQCVQENYLSNWAQMFQATRKPVIAAVNGFALGGGCELAMMCDIIIAGTNAKFSQPEIKLGTIPGGGGTQRLARAVGKSKAMEMILTGRHLNAAEAERIGLISKVVDPAQLIEECFKLANEISEFSLPALIMCKQAVNKSFEMGLAQGLDFERSLFHTTFALDDRREGMKAFLAKRKPNTIDNKPNLSYPWFYQQGSSLDLLTILKSWFRRSTFHSCRASSVRHRAMSNNESVQASQEVKEGSTTIVVPKGQVFYNPVQQFNRDLSISVISTFLQQYQVSQKRGAPTTIFEGLSATGLRSIRYALELPNVRIIANDLDTLAVDSIRRNIERAAAEHPEIRDIVQPSVGDANSVMHSLKSEGKSIDIIDLDPYGSAAPFMDSAVQTIANGGLLCVTCTDLAVLCAGHPETCFAKYSGLPVKGDVCHEGALRLVLQALELSANRYRRYIVPLISCSIDFYVRLFVKVVDSPVNVKLSSTKRGLIGRCVQCKTLQHSPFLIKNTEGTKFTFNRTLVNPLCLCCGARVEQCGPMWIGEIHDTEFVRKVLADARSDASVHIGTKDRIDGLLSVISEELHTPLFMTVPEMASFLRISVPPLEKLRSALLNAGYSVSGSHCDPNAIKTTAPDQFLWKTLIEWAKIEKKLSYAEGTPQELLLREISATLDPICFDTHPDSNPPSRKQGLKRFPENPTKNWGPLPRAKKLQG